MLLYANSEGILLRFIQTEEDEIAHPNPPEGIIECLEFDGATNSILIQRLHTDWYNFRLLGGQLLYKGQPIIISPSSDDFNERKVALTLAHALQAYNELPSPTNTQSIQAIRANNRLTLIIGKMLLREFKE